MSDECPTCGKPKWYESQITELRAQLRTVEAERDRLGDDLEREIEAHRATKRRLDVYIKTVIMAPIVLFAVHDADPVPLPTTQSLATLLDQLARCRAALAEDQAIHLAEKLKYCNFEASRNSSAEAVAFATEYLADRRKAAGMEEA